MTYREAILYLAQKVGMDIKSGGGGGGTDISLGITGASADSIPVVASVSGGVPTSWKAESLTTIANKVIEQLPKWTGGSY